MAVISDIEREDDKQYFRRYALTGNGVSPRPIPGVKVCIHVTGVEHNEEGKPKVIRWTNKWKKNA